MAMQQPILLVEDNPDDCEVSWRALRKAGVQNPIGHCVDGDDALNYISVVPTMLDLMGNSLALSSSICSSQEPMGTRC
jgi:hypothetical protein